MAGPDDQDEDELRRRIEREEAAKDGRESLSMPLGPPPSPSVFRPAALGFGFGLAAGGMAVLLILGRNPPRPAAPQSCPSCPTAEVAAAPPPATAAEAPSCAPCPSAEPAAAPSASASAEADAASDAACDAATTLAVENKLALAVLKFKGCKGGPKQAKAKAAIDSSSVRLATSSRCKQLPPLRSAAVIGAISGLAHCASLGAAAAAPKK